MLEIKERLFGTILKEQEEYTNRYIFKGILEDLLNHDFIKLKENDVIKELKVKISKDDEVYYKKSGCGYFIVFKENDYLVFMSGVPIWWIGDEDLTNYYSDVEELIEVGLVEKVEE